MFRQKKKVKRSVETEKSYIHIHRYTDTDTHLKFPLNEKPIAEQSNANSGYLSELYFFVCLYVCNLASSFTYKSVDSVLSPACKYSLTQTLNSDTHTNEEKKIGRQSTAFSFKRVEINYFAQKKTNTKEEEEKESNL